MLGRRQKIALVTIVLLVALYAASFAFPPEYQICGPNEYTHNKECSQYHLGPFVLLWIVEFSDAHNGLLTAIATIFVAGFTWTLYKTSKAQAELTLKALKLARDEFNATHRPKIAIRDAFMSGHKLGERVAVHYSLVNNGESEATIIESALDIEVRDRPTLMMCPDPRGRRDIREDKKLAPGESRPYVFISNMITWDGNKFAGISSRTPNFQGEDFRQMGLFFVGHIIYEDATKIRRHMAFRHRYHFERERFYPLGDPEHEYAD